MDDRTERLIRGVAAQALDHIARPPAGADDVIALAAPDELRAVFAQTVDLGIGLDQEPSPVEALLDAVADTIRYSVHTNHPRFLNQNFAGADPVAVVGDWLAAALNTTAATFEAAPVFTLMEHAVLHRLASLAGYPPSSPDTVQPSGIFCPGGSTATLWALQLARHRHRPELITAGAGPERFAIFVSASGHYAARKAAALLGLGMDAVVEVATDPAGAMLPDALRADIAAARVRGETPLAVIATAGTTVTAAFDDLDRIADVTESDGLWLHVDGAYGGSALFSEREAHRLRGVERSDSFVWNLHKMLGITQQCSALLVSRPEELAVCFRGGADYLFQPDKLHGDHDAGDRTFQCARRVDACKLWLTWKARGDRAFAERIDHAVALAAYTRAALAAENGAFHLLPDGGFTNVVFLWVPPDLRGVDTDSLSTEHAERLHRLAPAIKRQMQEEGTAMVGYQPVHGVNAFRLLFMNPAVDTTDVDAIVELIDEYGRRICD